MKTLEMSAAIICDITGSQSQNEMLQKNIIIPLGCIFFVRNKYRTLIKVKVNFIYVGGTVGSWLVHLTPERAVQVQDMTRDIVLCSWARHKASLHPGV